MLAMEQSPTGRTTAPQSDFTRTQVLIGAFVLLLAIVLVVILPLIWHIGL